MSMMSGDLDWSLLLSLCIEGYVQSCACGTMPWPPDSFCMFCGDVPTPGTPNPPRCYMDKQFSIRRGRRKA